MARNLNFRLKSSTVSREASNGTTLDYLTDDDQPETIELDDCIPFMRHRSRAGFVSSDAYRVKLKHEHSTEVYDRQRRIADQIAAAMNSATDFRDKNYSRAAELLAALRTDIKKHGNELFGDPRLANYFIGAVSEALSNGEQVNLVRSKSGKRPHLRVYYQIAQREA